MSTHSSRILTTLFFLFLSVHPLEAASAFTPFVAEAVEGDVNVRAGQSKNFERIYQLEKGEEVIVLDNEYSWFKIQLPTKAKVYISEKYVLKRRSDQGQVTADNVNLRAGPDINFSVIGQAKEGQLVVIKDHKDGWYTIEPIKGNFGWVSQGLLKFKSDTLPAGALEEIVQAQPQPDADEPKTDAPRVEPTTPAAATGEAKVVTGILSAQKDGQPEGVYYRIDDNGKTYYIQGLNFSLDNFIGFKVRAEGNVKAPSFNNSGDPLLKLSKIQLIL